jgi:hypothetical protein
LQLWAIVDPEQPKQLRTIHIVGTGNPMPANLLRYIGTAQRLDGVWHVFEESPQLFSIDASDADRKAFEMAWAKAHNDNTEKVVRP